MTSWNTMKLSNKIKLHPLTVLVLGIGLLTGYFKYIFFIFFIVAIHEFGHVCMALIFKRKVVEIEILPFGGLTKMEGKISDDICEDLLIGVGGIFFQVLLGYLMVWMNYRGMIDVRLYEFLATYNIFIIGFNLLPICPLDGYKITKSFVELFVPYKLSYVLALVVSCLFLGGSLVLAWEILADNIFVLVFLIFSIFEEWKMRKYVLMKFYIERMNYDFYYTRADISCLSGMFKNRTNYINGIHEREYISRHLTRKAE